MGTTLTKPVLLDETGQDIVDKLDEIKTAIGGTGEFIPIMIKVTTPPTKTTYGAGETLDLTGMVVELFGSNGARFDVTEQCTFSPANGTVLNQNTSVEISYEWYKDQSIFTTYQNVRIKSLASIAVSTPPIITEYNAGDTLDLAGMVVTATFDDNSTIDATSQCVFSPADGAILSITDSTIDISLTISGITKTTTQQIEVYGIYGVTWDGTASSAFTRTDAAANFVDPSPYYSGMTDTPSSPFDSIMPWAGMTIVDDAEGGKLVQIPKYYYKWTQDGNNLKLQISTHHYSDFFVSPAHADRGDGNGERDVVYIGRYKCSSDNFKSVSGDGPKVSTTRDNFRSSIHALGSTIWQNDFAMYWTIMMLYLVEFADWNAQAKIGGGGSKTTAAQQSYERTFNTGLSDSIPYHTGTTSPSIASNVYGVNQYRNIESLWGNCFEYVDGIFFESGKVYCIKNPANFGDATNIGSAAVQIGTRNTTAGEITDWEIPSTEGFEYALLPKATISNNNYNTYCCDRWSSSSSSNNFMLLFGGGYVQSQEIGPFYLNAVQQTTYSELTMGSRLMKLP